MRLFSRALLVLIGTVACQSAPRAQQTDTAAVTVFRGGSDHAGRFDSPTGSGYSGLAWRVATEGPVRSSPAVTRSLVLIGSGDGNLYAIERATGRVR